MAYFEDSVFKFPQDGANITGANSPRLPWNNTIFPGNYVAHLNAYRDQNVQAFPGVNFFRLVGAYVVPQGVGDIPGSTAVATGPVDLKILSPDLREDDKPRLDRDVIIRATAGGGAARVYRVGISTVNLKGNASTITTNPTDLSGVTQPTLTSAAASAGGEFRIGGEFTDFAFDTALDPIVADQAVNATVGVADLQKIDTGKEAAILVEVCFFMNAPAPDADDVHLPYYTESGQSSQ